MHCVNKLKQELDQAVLKTEPYVHKTPVLTSKLLDEISGAKLYFKCENFQRMGAFKMRGAVNAILSLTHEQLNKGVTTHSSGNFAQALALAAKGLGVKAYIVMPENAPKIKKDAVRDYGAQIIECHATLEDREKTSLKVIDTTGATFIHPYNDLKVIAGQGTAAFELIESMKSKYNQTLDYMVSPVGGGGLISGASIATKHYSPSTKLIGAEPKGACDAWQSLNKGELVPLKNCNTIADGLRTSLGDITFPIILNGVERIILVEENEIVTSMKLVWERMKMIIEPSSAVTLAAIIKNPDLFVNKHIGLIISGGNVDLNNLPF